MAGNGQDVCVFTEAGQSGSGQVRSGGRGLCVVWYLSLLGRYFCAQGNDTFSCLIGQWLTVSPDRKYDTP